jgi:hypothetical protein
MRGGEEVVKRCYVLRRRSKDNVEGGDAVTCQKVIEMGRSREDVGSGLGSLKNVRVEVGRAFVVS